MYKRVIVLLLISIVVAQEYYKSDFQMFDSNDDGQIKYEELIASFPESTKDAPGQYITQFFADFDLNHDNTVTFSEYVQARDKQKKEYEEEQAKNMQYMHEDF